MLTLVDPEERAAALERKVMRVRFRPPPRLTVSQWADRYRILSPEACARPGRFSADDAPYQREFMDACGAANVPEVVAMWASQLGKTETINNVVGYFIDQAPSPILVIQPTIDMAEDWSKTRLAPMLRDTPRLSGKVADPRSRDSGNTLREKSFPGGRLAIGGANSPAGLAARPIRVLIGDERDRWPYSAGTEGDPWSIAEARTTSFPDPKKIQVSSPTIKGQSAIEAAYERSDQREYFVPCPHCGHEQTLEFGGKTTEHGLKWQNGDPTTTRYICRACLTPIEEHDKRGMLAAGRWIAQNPESKIPGFRLSTLYSPYLSWAKVVEKFLKVKDKPLELRTFVNTVLCQTWEDEGQSANVHVLVERYETYKAQVPEGVAVLTRSVDVQGDRLETTVWGYGRGEESWPIEHEIIAGDPGTAAPWEELKLQFSRDYEHELGSRMRPVVTVIDTGGHHAHEVFTFCKANAAHQVFPIKGSSIAGAPIFTHKATRSKTHNAMLFLIGAFTGKESILAKLNKISSPGPGYIHVPDWLDGEQLQQFTNEKLVTRFVGGRPVRTFVQTGRNEMLDLAVYAFAAFHKLRAKDSDLIAWLENLKVQGEKVKAAAAAPATPAAPAVAGSTRMPPRRGGGFARRW